MGLFSLFHDDPELSRAVGLMFAGRRKIYDWLIDTVSAETGATHAATYTAVNAAIPRKGEAMLSDPAAVSRLFTMACAILALPDADQLVSPLPPH